MKALFDRLFKVGSVPYFAMLRSWLQKGNVNDPWGTRISPFLGLSLNSAEFCIAIQPDENGSTGSFKLDGDLWGTKYTIREQHVLDCLQPVAAKILATGKYFHVVNDRYHVGRSEGSLSLPEISANTLNEVKYQEIHQVYSSFITLNSTHPIEIYFSDFGDSQGS